MVSPLMVCSSLSCFPLGYETTANTLAYCVYNIAAHPEVQARLLAEVDSYGRGRKVAYRDLDQVRAVRQQQHAVACHVCVSIVLAYASHAWPMLRMLGLCFACLAYASHAGIAGHLLCKMAGPMVPWTVC
jgi:hypothetical protein